MPDLAPALARARAIVDGLVAAIPNAVVALAVFAVALLAVLFIGLLVALSVALPTFQPGDVVPVLGISSVAIGFAFRDILQNFLAGILLLLTQPFRVGDQIAADAYEGTVEDIQTRATFIRTYDGRRVVIPNAVFTDTVVVNTAFEHRRLEFDVGIGYAAPANRPGFDCTE